MNAFASRESMTELLFSPLVQPNEIKELSVEVRIQQFEEWMDSLNIAKYWLDSSKTADSYLLCKEMLHFLQDFSKLTSEGNKELQTLAEMGHGLDTLEKQLEKVYLQGHFPLTNETTDCLKVVILARMELAKNYSVLLKKNNQLLSAEEKTLITHKALQALGKVLLCTAIAYTEPQQNFWVLCYQLIKMAELADIHLLTIKTSEGHIITLENRFKQILLFQIFYKDQFSPREMKAIFQGLTLIVSKVKILTLPEQRVWTFNLESNAPPQKEGETSPSLADNNFYLDLDAITLVLRSFLVKNSPEKKVLTGSKRKIFTRIYSSLKIDQKRSFTRIKTNQPCQALIGLDNIMAFLANGSSAEAKPIKQDNQLLEDLSLDWEQADIAIEKTPKGVAISGFTIIDSSLKGYGIIWNIEKVRLKVGHLFGVLKDETHLEIGVIRRINRINNGFLFGLEIIGLKSSLVHIKKKADKSSEKTGLFIHKTPDQNISLIYQADDRYLPGGSIILEQEGENKVYQLGGFIRSTSIISHINLIAL